MLLEHDGAEFWQLGFKRRFAVFFKMELRVCKSCSEHSFIAPSDIAHVLTLDVAYCDELRQQGVVLRGTHSKKSLVFLHRGHDDVLGKHEVRWIELCDKCIRPFNRKGRFGEERLIMLKDSSMGAGDDLDLFVDHVASAFVVNDDATLFQRCRIGFEVSHCYPFERVPCSGCSHEPMSEGHCARP